MIASPTIVTPASPCMLHARTSCLQATPPNHLLLQMSGLKEQCPQTTIRADLQMFPPEFEDGTCWTCFLVRSPHRLLAQPWPLKFDRESEGIHVLAQGILSHTIDSIFVFDVGDMVSRSGIFVVDRSSAKGCIERLRNVRRSAPFGGMLSLRVSMLDGVGHTKC
jgi:hypothetical protein